MCTFLHDCNENTCYFPDRLKRYHREQQEKHKVIITENANSILRDAGKIPLRETFASVAPSKLVQFEFLQG